MEEDWTGYNQIEVVDFGAKPQKKTDRLSPKFYQEMLKTLASSDDKRILINADMMGCDAAKMRTQIRNFLNNRTLKNFIVMRYKGNVIVMGPKDYVWENPKTDFWKVDEY